MIYLNSEDAFDISWLCYKCTFTTMTFASCLYSFSWGLTKLGIRNTFPSSVPVASYHS